MDHFNDLYLYFWENIQELQFSEIYNQIPVFDSENKSDKEMNDYFRIVGIYTHGSNNSVELPEAYKKYGSPAIGWNSLDKLSDIINGKNFPAENPDGSLANPLFPRTKVKC